MQGIVKKGQQVAWMREDGSVTNQKVVTLTATEGIDNVEIDEADRVNSYKSRASKTS